ncbi:MAG: ATP-dependent DNA helicase RecG [Chloroflexi bacterium]|nr:ATP-dependent DNA helicase RecG [Chloroflexota bacterium]
MPNSATEKLAKILKLEAERGYQDKAVTRGLASFANAWLADAAKSNIDSAWAASVADEMRAYSAATDIAVRRAALAALITRLHTPTVNTANQNNRPATALSTEAVSKTAAPRPERPRTPPQFADRAAPVKRASQATPGPGKMQPTATESQERAPKAGIPPAREESRAQAPTESPAPDAAAQRPPAKSARPAGTVARPTASPQQLDQFMPRRSSHAQAARYTGLGLNAPLNTVSGIGPQYAQRLARLGLSTVHDLLYFFPTRYDDYSALKTINQLEYGETVTIVGRVQSAFKHRTKTGLYIVRVTIEDSSGSIECSYFSSEWAVESLLKHFQAGREVVISGKVSEYLGRLVFQNPTHEPAEREWVLGGSIVPVYRLTEGLPALYLRRTMKNFIQVWHTKAPDFLPQTVRQAVGLMPLSEALREIHWPRDFDLQERARRRLAFDELFVMQTAVLKQRQEWRGETAVPIAVDETVLDALRNSLPYTLTGAQLRAISAIGADLSKPIAMHRLLQGDVGSGKTVVAALAMALAAKAGAQSALMAPTEILAEQHYKNLSMLFDGMSKSGVIEPLQVRLLTGSVKTADKQDIYTGLSEGRIQVAIGTHALIQEGVTFHNLGLVVVDEQHRFGVEQRKALRQKGQDANPHTLVMTATPIPRTLALTLYGDLDNTILDEMPPGRQPIETQWVIPAERERAYEFIKQQIKMGRQAFIICPLVEESDKVEATAAVEEHARLQKEVFPQLKLGLLHGRMKSDAKDEVMGQFVRGDLNILVSTSVVEVGIDVPNATVMMIEGANRFGLSQLHQFRGRVGRGEYHSYCLLIADTSAAVSDERLTAIVSTQDGFVLAEKDLELRGPGQFFGTRQSGDAELKLVNIRDRDLLTAAREQAERIFEEDAKLNAAEHQLLAEKVQTFWMAHESHGDAS